MNRFGWECPRCHGVYAPFIATCFKCNAKEPAQVSISPTKCTCGVTQVCLMHLPFTDAVGNTTGKVTISVKR